MAKLSNTIVSGKLAVTGRIFEGGQAIDDKFASSCSFDSDTRTFALKRSSGDNLAEFTLPSGSVSVAAATINTLTFGSIATNSKYTVSGSATVNPSVTTPGWITSSNIVAGTITVAGTVNQSKLKYRRANATSDSDWTATDNVTDINPGSTIYISAGYWPDQRILTVGKANLSGESDAGSITLSGEIGDTSSILQTSSSTGAYTITFTPGTSSFTVGWINAAPTGSAITRYIKKGSTGVPTASAAATSTSLSGTTITVARPVSPSISEGYITSSDGSEGTVTITATVPTESKTASAAGTISPAQGKLLDSVSVPAGTAGAVTGGTLSGGAPSVVNKQLSGSNVTLGDTDNGISVQMSATARRAAVTRAAASYSITTAGWISSPGSALNADSTTLPQEDASDTLTKYISALTVPSSKILPTITLAGGTVTTLNTSANSTITTLSVDSGKTLTIGTLSGTVNITNAGVLSITNSSSGSGKIVLKNKASDSSYVTITDSAGDLKTTSIGSHTGSATGSISDSRLSLTSTANKGLPTSFSSNQPSSGYYLKVGIDSGTYTVDIKNSSAISEGWLSSAEANTLTLGTGTITESALTKYIAIAAGVVTGSVVNFSHNATNMAISNSETAYSVTASAKGKATVSTTGWVKAGTDENTSSASTDTIYIQPANITLGGSVTTNANVSLALSATSADATAYGIVTSQPEDSESNYAKITATNTKTTGVVTATNTITSEGYAKSLKANDSGEVDANKTIQVPVNGDVNKYIWIPKATPAFTGGGVSSSISSWNKSNVTWSDSNNGIYVSATPRSSRTAVTWNGACSGLINIANGTDASAAVGNTNGTAGTKYIAGINVPKDKPFTVTNTADTAYDNTSTLAITNAAYRKVTVANSGEVDVTSNSGTVKYETNWVITKDGSNNLTFTYSA